MATTAVASNIAPKSPRIRRLRVKSVTSIEPTNSNGSGGNLNGSDGNVSGGGSASSIMSPKAYSTGSRAALQIERRDPSKSPRPNRQTLGIHSPRTHVLAKNYLLEEENSPSKLSSLKSPHSIRNPAAKIVVGDEQRRRKVTESPRTSRKMTVVSRQEIRQYVKARNLRHASPPVPGELNMVSSDSPTCPVEELAESIPEPLQRKDGEVRPSSPRKHTGTSREHHRRHSSSPRKLHANQKSSRQNTDFYESHNTDLYLEAEDTDTYLSALMKELHQHTEQHREPLSDQAMVQLHLSRTQQLQGPGQGSEEEGEGEAEDDGIMMTLWQMKEQFRRDFPDARGRPMPSDAALKQRYKVLGLARPAVQRKSSFTSQNGSFSNVGQWSNSKSTDISALNLSSSYSDRVTSTSSMVNTKHVGDNDAVTTRVPVAIPWLDREDSQDNDGSLENTGESEDASPQTHRKSGITSFKSLASKVALAAKIVKSSNKTLEEISKGHNNVEDHERHEEGAKSKSKREKKDKVEEKLKKKEEKQLKKIEKAKQKLARAQRKLEQEKRPSKTDDDDTKTIHEEHEAKVDLQSTMGLSSESAVDLEQSGGLEEPEVASLSTKKAGKSGDSPPSKRRKSTLGKAMGRMSKILHPSHVKENKWDELAISEHSAFNLSVSRLQDSEEIAGERMSVSVTEQGSLQAQKYTGEEREVDDTNISISHPHDAYCDLQSSGQPALQFQPALKAQVEDHDAEYGEEALKSEPKPSRPDQKSRSSRTRSEDGRSSRSEGSRSRTSRSPSEVRSSTTKSSTSSTSSTSSRRSRRSKSPSALPVNAARSASRSSQRSITLSTVSGDAARSPSRSSSRRSKSPLTISGDAARRSPSRSSRPSKSPFTITSEKEKSSSRSSRRSKSPSTLSGEAAKNRSDEDDGSTRKHSSDDSSKLRRNSRSVSPSGLKEDVSRRRRETRSASPSALRGDIAKLRDANGDRRNSRRAYRRASTIGSGPLDDKTREASTSADCESIICRASRQASNSKAGIPDEEAHEGLLTIETMSRDEESMFVTASTASRVRFSDQHLEYVKDCKGVEGSSFAFAESQVLEDETEHTLSDTEFETICSMPQLPKSPDRLVLYVKNAGLITGTADAAVRCTSESKTFAERLAAMSTLGRRSDESEVKQVANAASSSETKRLKPRASSSSELEDMLKMVGKNGSSKNDQPPKSGDNASRVSRSSKASRASTKASRSSGRNEWAGRKRRGSTREEGSKVSSSNSDLTGKPALTAGFQGVSW